MYTSGAKEERFWDWREDMNQELLKGKMELTRKRMESLLEDDANADLESGKSKQSEGK